MNKTEYLKGLKYFLSENENQVLYILGSGNLMLQGVDVVPNDIDFIADPKTLLRLARKYNSPTRKGNGYLETNFYIGDTEYNIVSNVGNDLRPDDLSTSSVKIDLGDGFNVLGLSLVSEKNTYVKMNRIRDRDKLNKINAVLKND